MIRVARSAAHAGRALCLPASLMALASLLTVPMLHAQKPVPERAIDSLMARYAQPGGPGASLLVVRDGRTVLARGYGLADVERQVPVTAETNFRLASLSKQFTATAVMLLVAGDAPRCRR
jgi:CubicO group peptidase (beta-lactamase class C family)